MVRTVKVRLELDRDDYKRGLRDAANETRGFDAEVRSAGKDAHAMGAEVKSAGTQVEAMGREVDAAAKKTAGLGDEADKAKRKTTGLGEESKKTRQHIVDLAKDIEATKTSLRSLGEEFQRTGKVNVDELGKLSNGLRDLERAKALMDKLIPGGNGKDKNSGGGLLNFALDEFVGKTAKAAGGAILTGVEGGVQSAGKFAASNPWIALGIAAGITLGLPVIGAAITGAVGGGVIAGGLLLAAKDPRVGSAWGAVADTAKGKLTSAAGVFVDPLIRGAHTFESTLGRILPNIQHDFDRLAPTADRLFSGAAGFVERLMPGIDALSSAAGPVLNDLAAELPKLGAAVSQAFKDIAGGGAGGAQAMRDMLTSVEITIGAVGKLIGWLEKWYLIERSIASGFTGDWDGAVQRMAQVGHSVEETTRVGGLMVSTFQNVAAAVGSAGPAAQLTGGQLKSLSDQINAVTLTADILKGQMVDKVMGAMLGASHATLGVAESLTSLDSTFKGIGPAIDSSTGQIAMNTQAGQRQREAVLSAIEANLRQYDVMIQSGSSAEDAAKKYDTNTKALHDQLRQAGLTEAQVHDLIGEYGNVPNKVNTTVATQGLTTAIENLGDLIRKLNGMPTRRDIYITQHLSTTGGFSYKSPDRLFDYPAGRFGAITSFADGGVAPGIYQTLSGPGIFKFAEPEAGPEAYIPRNIDHSRAMSIAAEVGDWHGFDVVPRQAASYAAFANSRPMTYGGGGSAAQVSPDALAGALARQLAPMMAQMADRPVNVNVDSQRIAQAVRQGNRSLERQG